MWDAGAPPLARETGRLLGAGRERRDAGAWASAELVGRTKGERLGTPAAQSNVDTRQQPLPRPVSASAQSGTSTCDGIGLKMTAGGCELSIPSRLIKSFIRPGGLPDGALSRSLE